MKNSNTPDEPDPTQDSDRIRIPVIEETVDIGKRRVDQGGLRVVKRVHEREQRIDAVLKREYFDVERIPVNQEVPAGVVPGIRTEGDRTIIPVVEETLIVEKRLVVREEIHIVRREQELREPKQVTLRSESVEIERIDSEEGEAAQRRSE